MEQWTNFLKFQNTPDGILRLLSVVILSIVLIKYSTVFENEYSGLAEESSPLLIFSSGVELN